MHLYAICVDCLEGVHKIVCIKCKSRWDGSWHQLGTMYTYDILAASPCCQVMNPFMLRNNLTYHLILHIAIYIYILLKCHSSLSAQARLNCKHCGKPVIDVRVGMQYFSEYSNVQQCPHCGNLDYHFVKPFSSFKVLEASLLTKVAFACQYFFPVFSIHRITYFGLLSTLCVSLVLFRNKIERIKAYTITSESVSFIKRKRVCFCVYSNAILEMFELAFKKNKATTIL